MEIQKHIDAVMERPGMLGVFGLILFTDRHPHLAKVMGDDDYWKAFNSISGDSFAIFSAKPANGRYVLPSAPPGFLQMMVPIWSEPEQNNGLLSTFHLNSTEHLPKFVVFAQMPDGRICQCSIKLTDQSEAHAYAELRKVIDVVSAAAKKIGPEYSGNTENVYLAFEQAVSGFKQQTILLTMSRYIPFVKEALSFFAKS